MSVFYDVLMEKSAQRQEREEQQGLSLGQKAGVGAAALAGTVGGPIGLDLAGKVSPTFSNYISPFHGGEAYQAKLRDLDASRSAAIDALDKPRNLAIGSIPTQKKLDELDAAFESGEIPENLQPIFKKRRELLVNAIDAEAALDDGDFLDNTLHQNRKKSQRAFSDHGSGIFDAIKKERGNIGDTYDKSRRALQEGMHQRVANIYRGAMLGGGLALGYGAKKLFDRYNERKRSEQR